MAGALQDATALTPPLQSDTAEAPSHAPSNDNNVGVGLDIISKEFEKLNSAAPQQQITATPAPARLSEPEIPAPPPPIPGAYNPDQEQASLRAAEAISNPAERLRLQGVLKREYANQRMMDGVTKAAREDAKNKSFADYAKATHELITDTKTDWSKKQLIMKRLNEVMWQDPTLDYGDAKELLQNHMMKIATMPNTMAVGRGYQTAQDGILAGTITSNEQILRMEQQGLLTHEGSSWAMQNLREMHEPKGAINADRTEFFKRYSRTIDPAEATGERSPLGDRAMYRAERAARLREQELAKKPGGNPADVYNPDSKEFFGSPENLAKYTVSFADAIHSIASATTPAAPSGAPGGAPAEKPEDATHMTREQILSTFKPGTLVTLPDGRQGRVPYPRVPMSQ